MENDGKLEKEKSRREMEKLNEIIKQERLGKLGKGKRWEGEQKN